MDKCLFKYLDYLSLPDFKNSETAQIKFKYNKFKIQQKPKTIPNLKNILLNKYCLQQHRTALNHFGYRLELREVIC